MSRRGPPSSHQLLLRPVSLSSSVSSSHQGAVVRTTYGRLASHMLCLRWILFRVSIYPTYGLGLNDSDGAQKIQDTVELSIHKKLYAYCVCVCALCLLVFFFLFLAICKFATCVFSHRKRGHKKASELLELELWVVMSFQTQVLGTELWVSTREASILNC